MKTQTFYMGIDQYGTRYDGLVNPRKDLLQRLGRNHAEKMYTEYQDGTSRHSGYIIAGLWIEVFEVKHWHAKEEHSK